MKATLAAWFDRLLKSQSDLAAAHEFVSQRARTRMKAIFLRMRDEVLLAKVTESERETARDRERQRGLAKQVSLSG